MVRGMSDSPKRKSHTKKVMTIIMILLACYVLFEPYWIQEKQIVFESADLPAAFDEKKVVYLTDIHHGPFFSLDRVRALEKRVNLMNPDLILLGGDYVHRDPKYIEPCFEALSKLKAPLGVYGVLGNHDHWEGAARCRLAMSGAGVGELDNTGVWLTKGQSRIRLCGVGDMFEDVQNQNVALESATSRDFVIMLSHSPDFFPISDHSKIDLMLSGHTHGGQVTLFGLWAPLIPSKYGQTYRTGVHHEGGSALIVSNGIGTITPPVRFFARPQIMVVTLKHKAP